MASEAEDTARERERERTQETGAGGCGSFERGEKKQRSNRLLSTVTVHGTHTDWRVTRAVCSQDGQLWTVARPLGC